MTPALLAPAALGLLVLLAGPLLAHLAVEKGVWGPHLIIVPTSVMLNWEM
jgi:hypothetical protein